MKRNKIGAILYALLAAVFYAVNVPLSKLLLEDIGPTMMAAFLYLGAGIGIGVMSLMRHSDLVGENTGRFIEEVKAVHRNSN